VDEVELLLLVVVVPAALVAGGHDDGVDAEGGDVEGAADLAEAVAVAHGVEVGGGVAVAGDGVGGLGHGAILRGVALSPGAGEGSTSFVPRVEHPLVEQA